MRQHRTNTCIPEGMVEELRRVAGEKGVSVAEIIRRALDEWLHAERVRELQEKGESK